VVLPFGEGTKARAVSAIGASIGARFASRHRFQFDYLFSKRQFITGTYVVQRSVGRSRPFFQIGVGIETQHAGPAVLLGAGGHRGLLVCPSAVADIWPRGARYHLPAGRRSRLAILTPMIPPCLLFLFAWLPPRRSFLPLTSSRATHTRE
jgi:hypothetical protein